MIRYGQNKHTYIETGVFVELLTIKIADMIRQDFILIARGRSIFGVVKSNLARYGHTVALAGV